MPVPSNPIVDGTMKTKQSHTTSKLGPQQMVHWFVASSYASGSFTEERVRNSVALLHRVPAARNAVLHRFTMLFEDAVRSHLDHIEFQSTAPGISPEIASSLELVVNTLFELLEQSGKAWATILCNWSVEALGQVSSCSKQRQTVPPPGNLGHLLSFWLNVVPMRMLLDVYRTCLKILIENSPQSCVDSLLKASASHSPHFDWVVADVGSAFPDAIVERVLYTGFSKFCKLRWTPMSLQPSASITMNENEQTILTSVTRVLEHLFLFHPSKVCNKIVDMFKTPPSGKSSSHIKVTLYLMNLFSVSPVLLPATTEMFVDLIDATRLNNLYKQFQKLNRSPEEIANLSSLVVHLVCKSSSGSAKLISFLLATTCSKPTGKLQGMDKGVCSVFSKIVSLLMDDLKHMALKEKNETSNVFTEISANYEEYCNNLLISCSTSRKTWWYDLLLVICFYKSYANSVLSYILTEANTHSHLEIFLQFYNDVAPVTPDLLDSVLQKSFQSLPKLSTDKALSLLTNINSLCAWDEAKVPSEGFKTRLIKKLLLVIDDIVLMVCKLPIKKHCAKLCVDILYQIMSTTSTCDLGLGTRLLPLTQSLVYYFYYLLHTGHKNNDAAMQSCHRVLVQLTQTPETFSVVCRLLLEASVTQEDNSVLFGKRIEPELDENEMSEIQAGRKVNLLALHQKAKAKSIFKSSLSNGFVPVSVEAGRIGVGPKKKKKCPISQESQSSNNECLSLLLYRCSCKTSGNINLNSFTIPDVRQTFDSDKLLHLADCIISTITVSSPQLATTITLDGDTEWPSCNTRKLTIERDLQIFYFLDEHPFVWQLLFLIAHNHCAFNKVSSIIRSCMSVLLSHYESDRYQTPLPETSLHYQVATKVMQLLGKGKLVPEPLCFVGQFFHQISPFEVSVLLTTVWNFIKEHPSDAEQSSENQREFKLENINLQPFLTVVHHVLHANITNLGYLFSTYMVTK
uniref:Integrator complex subunit 5-like n=1 Tax=Phallusia mammillata TaxID=59560 RepID=A0A6F9DFR2_9ASCI|nr:integrator complex subunit 5-like [Phallusia mammillata]